MAAPVIVVERYRVEHGQGFTMPVISLTDRRAAGNRLVRFVFQRHLETVLYGRSDGSSGPIWKVMNTAGIGSTTMAINKAAVTSGVITEDEFQAVMEAFKSALPADVVDPSSLGRIRNCTIIPLAAAATVVRTFGRCPASTAWLRALSQPIPHAWELREEQEANDAVGEVDFVLEEKLDDANFEADESSFASELMTMPAFSADKDDDARLKTYILQRVPPMLKKELDSYLLFRTQTFAARRAGGAVQSISAETDTTALLRFYGWMAATNRPVLADSITFMIREDLGEIAQAYAQWLQTTQQCKFSTIANYLNGLVSITSLLLRQPRAQRCAAGNGSQPADSADQSARPGREGEQDAADVRQARGRLDRVVRCADGSSVGHEKARGYGRCRCSCGQTQPLARLLRALTAFPHSARPRGMHS